MNILEQAIANFKTRIETYNEKVLSDIETFVTDKGITLKYTGKVYTYTAKVNSDSPTLFSDYDRVADEDKLTWGEYDND